MSITPLPTKAHMAAEAARQAQARATDLDSAAVAGAQMAASLRAALYQAISESRTGLFEDDLVNAYADAPELTRVLLAALVADGEVELYQGVYRMPRGAA